MEFIRNRAKLILILSYDFLCVILRETYQRRISRSFISLAISIDMEQLHGCDSLWKMIIAIYEQWKRRNIEIRNIEKLLDFSSVYFFYTWENLRRNFHVLRCAVHSDTFNNTVIKIITVFERLIRANWKCSVQSIKNNVLYSRDTRKQRERITVKCQ